MAVYTDVDDRELTAFLTKFELGDLLSYKGIAEGVENTNYFLQTTQGKFILTLYEQRVADEDLPFFLGLMEHLAGEGVACPTPIRTSDGDKLSKLSGRSAAIVTFLDGFCVHEPAAHHCRDVGHALANLHLAGQSFDLRRTNALGLAGWRPLFDQFQDQADTIAPGLSSIIAKELECLDKAWPTGLKTGVIHADLFPDNVFFLGETLSGLIDFYFACNDILALDIAICLNAWCFDSDDIFDINKSRALFSGYQDVRKLSDKERAALPVLARGGALRFLLTRSYDWLHAKEDAIVNLHQPRHYLSRLKFHQSVTSPEAYGLEAE